MQEDATLRILDHGCDAWTYGQSGFLHHWTLKVTPFLLPADWLVAALAEAAVDEILVDRAWLAALPSWGTLPLPSLSEYTPPLGVGFPAPHGRPVDILGPDAKDGG
jgi:hypothetical protein